MVKLSGAAANNWVKSPDRSHWAVLFFGPNHGLVSDRARNVVSVLSGGAADDPFLVSTIDSARQKSDSSTIIDEAFSQSLMGGDKTVWIKEGSDKIAGQLEAALEQGRQPNFLVVEAGELPPRSKLRGFFERSDKAAAIGCYDDDERALAVLVGNLFSEWEIRADRDAMNALVDRLGSDRLANLSEIEEACLYAGKGGHLSEDDISALAMSPDGASIDELVYAVFEGNRERADELLAEAWSEGVASVQIVRRMQNHLHRLLLVRAKVDKGDSPDKAVASLRPPVFFKFKDRFRQQTYRWPRAQIEKCMGALVELEVECKSTGAPDQALCQRICLSIAGLAQRL